MYDQYTFKSILSCGCRCHARNIAPRNPRLRETSPALTPSARRLSDPCCDCVPLRSQSRTRPGSSATGSSSSRSSSSSSRRRTAISFKKIMSRSCIPNQQTSSATSIATYLIAAWSRASTRRRTIGMLRLHREAPRRTEPSATRWKISTVSRTD